jgi:hypothetical protein
MFEPGQGPVSASALRSLLPWLAGATGLAPDPAVEGAVDDGEAIEQIEALEQLKSAIAARQARLSVQFDASQRARQRAAGVPAAQVGRGVADQIALARRESPTAGSRHLGLAKALVNEMPHTLHALAAGETSEWSATVMARETACLSAGDRRQVDAELADRLPSMSPAEVRAAAWAAACRLDPAAAAKRSAKAANDRYVSIRPAPDTMTYVSALLPVKDGVACYAALNAAANTAKASGDPRGRGQLMADAFVERLTRRRAAGAPAADGSVGLAAPASAAAPDPAAWGTVVAPTPIGQGADTAVEVHLVVTDETLLAGGDAPALLTGPDHAGSNPASDLLPAPTARDLVRDAAKVWVRRLYTDPTTGQLTAMESTKRVFDGNLRRMLILRDRTCRTPWCDAPIRHGDHITDAARGGPTSLDNGQGLCERCNQTKNLPGWRAQVVQTDSDSPPGRHTVRTTTPTGRTYTSTPPPLLGQPVTPAPQPSPSAERPLGAAPALVLVEPPIPTRRGTMPAADLRWHPMPARRPA